MNSKHVQKVIHLYTMYLDLKDETCFSHIKAKLASTRHTVAHMNGHYTYLPTVPDFAGLSRILRNCPGVPHQLLNESHYAPRSPVTFDPRRLHFDPTTFVSSQLATAGVIVPTTTTL